jgi:CRISPR type III-A-associated protein Csm2
MSENEQDVPPTPPVADSAGAAHDGATAHEGGDSAPDSGAADGGAPEGGSAPGEHAKGEPGKGGREGGRKRRRGPKGGGGGGGGGPNNPRGPSGPHGGGQGGHAAHGGHHGHRYVEDRIDIDAEQLARESRSIPFAKLRPVVLLTHQVRRLLTSSDPHDRREARRALVLFKSKIAYLAGRESGRERNAFVRIRDFLMKGIDQVTHDRETLDPQQARNFLDNVDAFVGYHRFHSDDRRRD